MNKMTVIAAEMLDAVSGGATSYSTNITVSASGLSTDTLTYGGKTTTFTYQLSSGTPYVPGNYSYSYPG